MFDQAISAIAKRAAIVIAVGSCLFVSGYAYFGLAELGVYANDFVVYWNTANGPVSNAYAPVERHPFPYMPTMLLWLQPLKLLGAFPAYACWVIISALTFTWASRKYLTMGQNLLALMSKPVVFCLLTGQVSVFLAAIMLWAFGAERKWLGGVALGLVASVKPQLVLLAPLLLFLRRDFQMILATGASLAATVLASVLAFGIQPWIDWLGSLEHFRHVLNNYNILRAAASPAGQAERFGYSPWPFLAFGVALGSWLVHRCRNLGPVEVTAAVATASLFAAPYSLTYDMAAIVPFLVVTTFQNRLLSPVALTALFPPLPIFISSFELLRTAKHGVTKPWKIGEPFLGMERQLAS